MPRRDRTACMSDLKKYFKKSDLLGNLTHPERVKLRENIGIHEILDSEGMLGQEDILYSDLLEKVKHKSIIVGKIYNIIDFQTIYNSGTLNEDNKEQTWGRKGSPYVSPTYNLIVKGIDKALLDTRAYIKDKDWHVEYDITQETFPDGFKSKGKITYLEDSQGNSAYYDFKNIRFRRTSEILGDFSTKDLDLYTFSNVDVEGNVSEASERSSSIKNNRFGVRSYNNTFLGNTYNNTFEADCKRNTFIRGCNDSHILWESVDNIFHQPVSYTRGSIQRKKFAVQETLFSSAASKTINRIEHDGNAEYVLVYIDPITYSHQVVLIKRD